MRDRAPGRVCEARVRRCGGKGRDARGAGGAGTHSNERKGAARVDCDANRTSEMCVGADVVVVEATRICTIIASAGESGSCPGGDVDTADPVIGKVL